MASGDGLRVYSLDIIRQSSDRKTYCSCISKPLSHTAYTRTPLKTSCMTYMGVSTKRPAIIIVQTTIIAMIALNQ